LPLSFLSALLAVIAGVLVARQAFGVRAAQGFLAGFFGLVAVASVLVGLRFGYGWDGVRSLQPILPLFFGPVLYLGFRSLVVEPERLPRLAALHLGVALALGLMPVIAPVPQVVPDWSIAASYLVYAGLLARLWRGGADGMVRARLEIAARAARWAGLAAAFLCLLLVFDSLIAVFLARQQTEGAVAIISAGALMTAAMLAVVVLRLAPSPEARLVRPDGARMAGKEAHGIVARATELIEAQALYLDTGLTSDRLARRMQMPVRRLSEAVNEATGLNMSQFVNGFRLRQAARLLTEGDAPVVAVMEGSGFLTRSNFYREFQRQFGMTPTDYRAANGRQAE
jgi:AraC-like DNA-binding protein